MEQKKIHKALCLQITKWWLYCRGSLGDIAISYIDVKYEHNKRKLWPRNIIPQEDSRINMKERRGLIGYMAKHHEDVLLQFNND